jgi:hypothetical protein
MSELYGASETAEAASEAPTTTRPESGSQEHADSWSSYAGAQDGDFGGYGDADLEAMLAAEERLPESRTRQEATADTWGDDVDGPDESDLATEYDGDVEALLTAEQHLPDSRTRHEAAADNWADASAGDDDPGSFSGDLASEYDGDVEAILAAEERLPESRTRQEAAAATWGDAKSGQGSGLDTSADVNGISQPDTVTEQPAHDDEGEDGAPGTDARRIAMHAQDGTEVPITVEYLPPEDRTVGDTTPTGVGRKPTGEELLRMEGDAPAEGPLDSFLRELVEDADDARDSASSIAETVHDFHLRGPGPGSAHAFEGHPVQDSPPSAVPVFTDLIGGAALAGVATLIGIRYWVRQLGKGDE